MTYALADRTIPTKNPALQRFNHKREPVTALNAVPLFVLTGCRPNEILPLEWDWIDEGRACIRLPDSKTAAKVVPIGAPVLRLLNTIPKQEGSPYVLPADRGDGHFVGIQRVWQPVRKAADLEGVRAARSEAQLCLRRGRERKRPLFDRQGSRASPESHDRQIRPPKR
jgi:integrase